jgi:hypothetical protein
MGRGLQPQLGAQPAASTAAAAGEEARTREDSQMHDDRSIACALAHTGSCVAPPAAAFSRCSLCRPFVQFIQQPASQFEREPAHSTSLRNLDPSNQQLRPHISEPMSLAASSSSAAVHDRVARASTPRSKRAVRRRGTIQLRSTSTVTASSPISSASASTPTTKKRKAASNDEAAAPEPIGKNRKSPRSR